MSDLMLKIEEPLKLNEKKEYTGVYKGVRYMITNFPHPAAGRFGMPDESWCFYLFINVTQQIPESLQKEFWLEPRMAGLEGMRKYVTHDYYEHAVSDLEFHGGCTFYEKESGLEGGDKWIKVGCDYQHLWDEGKTYSTEIIFEDVKVCIDSLEKLLHEHQFPLKAWSFKNGNWYDIATLPPPKLSVVKAEVMP